jgi:hypothetical protein
MEKVSSKTLLMILITEIERSCSICKIKNTHTLQMQTESKFNEIIMRGHYYEEAIDGMDIDEDSAIAFGQLIYWSAKKRERSKLKIKKEKTKEGMTAYHVVRNEMDILDKHNRQGFYFIVIKNYRIHYC